MERKIRKTNLIYIICINKNYSYQQVSYNNGIHAEETINLIEATIRFHQIQNLWNSYRLVTTKKLIFRNNILK